jgi:hypothetical protein
MKSSESPEGVGVRFSEMRVFHLRPLQIAVVGPARSVEGVIGLPPCLIYPRGARFCVGIASMVRRIPDRAMGLHRFNGGLHVACPMRSDG